MLEKANGGEVLNPPASMTAPIELKTALTAEELEQLQLHCDRYAGRAEDAVRRRSLEKISSAAKAALVKAGRR